MNKQIEVTSPSSPAVSRFELTDDERVLLALERFEAKERRALARLYDPFAAAFYEYTARGYAERFKPANLCTAFRFCAL